MRRIIRELADGFRCPEQSLRYHIFADQFTFGGLWFGNSRCAPVAIVANAAASQWKYIDLSILSYYKNPYS
jgi:hypothetical protein